jgi:hypothetical protein
LTRQLLLVVDATKLYKNADCPVRVAQERGKQAFVQSQRPPWCEAFAGSQNVRNAS